MIFEEIQKKVRKHADRDKAEVLKRFFKTEPGQYGEGDVFLGITVPELRKISQECRNTSVADMTRLLRSSMHEERALALFLLVDAYVRGDDAAKKKI
jgi:hypothetical protein